MKKNFKEVTCMEKLYDNDTILENQIGAKKTAFKKYFKKTFQKNISKTIWIQKKSFGCMSNLFKNQNFISKINSKRFIKTMK